MNWTKENVQTANEVYAVLTKSGCTIEAATQILRFVSRHLGTVSKVQPHEFKYELNFYEDK